MFNVEYRVVLAPAQIKGGSASLREEQLFPNRCATSSEAPTDLKPHQQELLEAYRVAKSVGSFSFRDSSRVRGDLVGTIGQLQKSYLLPNGQAVGKQIGIGLPAPCSEPKLHEITYSGEDKGYWLLFSALNNDKERVEALVLILEEREGEAAVKSFASYQKEVRDKELMEGYKAAKERGSFTFPEAERVRGDLVGAGGWLQQAVLLPNGNAVGKVICIGLPAPCSEPKLHEITYSPEDKGYWLRFSALNKDKERVESFVLILEGREGREGRDAVKSLIPPQKELWEAYRVAKSVGRFSFPDSSRVRGDLVGTNGQLQVSFLLPNGKAGGKTIGIGLPAPCSEPNLHEIRHSPTEGGYWLRMSALNKSGRPKVVEFLVSDDPDITGAAAILQKRVLGGDEGQDDLAFPEIFKQGSREALSSRPKGARAPRGEAREIVQAVAQTASERVTFVKGEAFEQLSGVLLSLQYPAETITPQFCLRVGQHTETGKGFFGMRADFRVGKGLIYEIKWGNATQNIIDTYLRHTQQLSLLARDTADGRPPYEYRLLLLQSDNALGERQIPYALFSDATESLDTRSKQLVTETQALLASLVHSQSRVMLEQLRDYLYTAFVAAQKEKDPTNRTERILTYLSKLHETPSEELSSLMKRDTTHYFSPLEAHFEWEGALHRGLIDPVSYYQEHPEAYELLYSFEYKFLRDGFRRLVFASKLDRDLAIVHECLRGSEIQEEKHRDEEVLYKPRFKFGDLWVTTHPECATSEDTVCISTLQELGTHLPESCIDPEFALEDVLAFVKEWTGRFGQSC